MQRPLCPIRLKEMSGPIDETMGFYSCSKRGCELHWRTASDYFRFFEAKPFRTFPQLQEEVLRYKVGHGHKFIAGRRGTRLFGNAPWKAAQKLKKGSYLRRAYGGHQRNEDDHLGGGFLDALPQQIINCLIHSGDCLRGCTTRKRFPLRPLPPA